VNESSPTEKAWDALATKIHNLLESVTSYAAACEAARDLYSAIRAYGDLRAHDERTRVLKPSESSPDLALAERLIRRDGMRSRWLGPREMRALTDELDRLRAELVRVLEPSLAKETLREDERNCLERGTTND
jgi:hypothetical protein